VSARPSVTRKQKTALDREIELGHHIPNVLINRMAKLENVRHKDELKRFASLYKKAKFSNLTEEYELIKDSISRLLSLFFQDTVCQIIEREMRASLAGQILDDRVRENFIHPFQVFAVGSIIIDRFYNHFKRWYGQSLCATIESCIEASWLLAAILHDGGKTRKIFKKELEQDIGSLASKIPQEDDYIRLLSSFYRHRSSGRSPRTWNHQVASDPTLEDILHDYSGRWSHGVKGAVLMLKKVCNAPENVKPRDVIAGFAIAIHDKEIWTTMQTSGFLPLRMDQFPLACLLLQLDAGQEWGRHRIVDTETRLVGIVIKDQSVTIEIAFESLKALQDKDAECNQALDCVDSRHLEISLDLRIKKRLNK